MARIDFGKLVNKKLLETIREELKNDPETLRIVKEKAWMEGYIAADNGRDEETNPYSKEN
jgi:hypothetical protein